MVNIYRYIVINNKLLWKIHAAAWCTRELILIIVASCCNPRIYPSIQDGHEQEFVNLFMQSICWSISLDWHFMESPTTVMASEHWSVKPKSL